MADDKDSSTEKKEVEEYLKQFCIEEYLDEILNEVIVERPTNPYVAMALLCESKTLPEILDVNFKSIIVGGELAVQADFTTNIATFSGVATYANVDLEEPKAFRDYSMIREKIRDALLDIDPVNLFKVDESVAKLAGINPAESLALSIACCRAGARHKGQKLYKYIARTAGLKEDDLCIPTPVVSVLSRTLDETQTTQDITLTATNASTFPSALELLLQTACAISKAEGVTQPRINSLWGSPCIVANNINVAAKLVQDVIVSSDLQNEIKQGLHIRAELLLKQPLDPVEPVFLYSTDSGPAAPPAEPPKKGAPVEPAVAPPKTGSELVEVLTALWQEVEFITLVDGVHSKDITSVKTLHKRVQETAYDLKASNSDTLRYSTSGVGGDGFCPMQIALDATEFAEIANIEQYTSEMPYNTVKLQLSRFASVSQAMEVVRKARSVKWPVAIVSNNTSALGPETIDTFLADFAVGTGSGQLMMGGVFASECTAKYNRVLEIILESPDIRYVAGKFRALK